jgi:tetratricopeptide (TPR) repeat protein
MLEKMKYSSGKIFLITFCLLLFHPGKAQNDPGAEARKLFNSGRYKEALSVFRDLTRLHPNDENLNYYLGACLAETNQFTDETKRALDIAKKEIPESWFYLGKYFHVRSDWKNAIQNYEQFKSKARKKSVEASSVNELINMCRSMKNPFPVVEINSDELIASLAEKTENPVVAEPVVTEVPAALKDSLIHFQVNAVVSYNKIDQFKFDDSKEAFIKGWLIEQDIQKKMAQLSDLRKEYGSLIGPAQDSLVDRILKLEQETYRMNQQARNAYLEANLKEVGYWNKAGSLDIENFRREISRIQDSVRTAAEEKMRKQAEEKILVILPDTAVVPDTVSAAKPTPASGVVYKIQIGAYRNAPPDWVQGQFRKLAVIRRIDQHVDEKGVTVYTVGELKSYDDAVRMQKQIQMEGIKNAFVAAYINNKRISLEEAKKLTEQ